jgi:hypothetical protein
MTKHTRFRDAPQIARCTYDIRLRDGSGAQCGRYAKLGSFCTQHARIVESAPQVGGLVNVRGQQCRIFKVRPFGTLDVVTLDGERAYRVSGLALLRELGEAE